MLNNNCEVATTSQILQVRKTPKLYRHELMQSLFPLIIKSQYSLVSHLLFKNKVLENHILAT